MRAAWVIGAALLCLPEAACAEVLLHEGGTVMRERNARGERFILMRPTAQQRASGLVAGDVLAEGRRDTDGRFVAQAYLHSGTCPPVAYVVAGSAAAGGIVLRGTAPTLDKATCRVVGRTPKALGFLPDAGAAAPPALHAAETGTSPAAGAAPPPFATTDETVARPASAYAPGAYNAGGIKRY